MENCVEFVHYAMAMSTNPSPSIPRSEYPRPQWVRSQWLCLNGPWEFEIDPGESGLARGLLERPLADRIIVPFCPESELSGIGNTDFLIAVWYRREVAIPQEWEGQRILLHFQACDYDTFVYANGLEVGRHRGGMTPFACDLTGHAIPGQSVTLVVRVHDDMRDPMPSGKQSKQFANSGALYTRTTGIWQTVWLEPVPQRASMGRPKITPDITNARFLIEQPVIGAQAGLKLRARLRDERGVVVEAETRCGENFYPRLELPIPPERVRLWSMEDPHLYDIDLELIDEAGQIVDQAASYAGLRSVCIDGFAIKLNGKRVFQRLVLDQGYYPDGILTAPSDEALVRDIQLSQAAGFNGARLHQKVFEERFLYHADRLGYLVWGEFSDWGSPKSNFPPSYVTQWLEALQRDFNHPSLIGWCPLNESDQRIGEKITAHDDVMRAMFLTTKLYDPTRPVLDISGYSHRLPEADIYDCHDYTQDPAEFARRYSGVTGESLLANTNPSISSPDEPRLEQLGLPIYRNQSANIGSIPYRGQPYFVSEFGGIQWSPEVKEGEASWGYGKAPQAVEEFYRRFEGLCRVLLEAPYMFGYCYTQLTDVFQEQNGLFFFDRRSKFDVARLRAIQQRPAAIE